MVSIIILSYNAKVFTRHTIKTLQKTQSVEFETIVLDNGSSAASVRMLKRLKAQGAIDKLILLDENTFFAKGNNRAFEACDPSSKAIVLLNSDVEIRDREWLTHLMNIHQKGSTSFGLCDNEPHIRGDGYCIMIDRDLYDRFRLDEQFEWWWSITKLQAEILNAGYAVTAVKNHESLLHHYGGMSGSDWVNAAGMNVEGNEVKRWFKAGKVNVIDKIEGNAPSCSKAHWVNFYAPIYKVAIKIQSKFKKRFKNLTKHKQGSK